MREPIKTNKGITLIALVITIIVLLILAGVSLSLVMGQNGILTQAKKAVEKDQTALAEEEIALAWASCESDYWSAWANNSSTTKGGIFTKANIAKYLPGTVDEFTYNEDGTGSITYKSNSSTKQNSEEFVIDANGKVTKNTSGSSDQGSGAGGNSVALSTITSENYGDYIDFGESIEGVGTSATTDDWRILYNDKNGHVYAILADYLPNSNAAVTLSGLDVVDNNTYNVNSSTSGDDLLSKLNSTTAWQSLIPEGLRSTCQVKGATTADIIMASYNEKYGTSLEYTNSPYLYIDADSTKGIDTLYMPHPGSRDYNGCYGYWLASPRAGDPVFVWYVICYGYVSNGVYANTYMGVCPVVSLPSNIQVTKNGNIWTVVQ